MIATLSIFNRSEPNAVFFDPGEVIFCEGMAGRLRCLGNQVSGVGY